jgi:diguanylate cyclase (GGDEF)-like protein
MRILLVEDDEILMNVLQQSLTSQHYVVDTAEDGQTGWDYAQSASYDLILMDVGLPRIDGIALCQRLRSQGCSTPILLITARDAKTDRVRGLDAGADDYLVKPLDLSELQARVRALLRRGEVAHSSVLQLGQLRLDPRSCQVSYGEKLLTLTPKEYSLLELFLRNPSRVFSRGQIVEHLWTFDDPPQEDSVKAHIKGLRQKLKTAGAADWIENVYGLGYRLKQEPERRETSAQAQPVSPTSSIEQQFSQAIGDLWQQYAGLMAQRLTVLQEAAIALQAEELTETLRQAASQAAHKLAGVLGMFERQAGTILAREIEQLLHSPALSLTQANQLSSLVQQLSSLLNLAESTVPAQTTSFSQKSRLLLIDPDLDLGQELQDLARSRGQVGEIRNWTQLSLESAKIWLQTHSPEVVVLGMSQQEQQNSLALLADLSARTPSIPVLVLACEDGLLDRVTVAHAGGQGFLVRPVTAAQVWAGVEQLLRRTRSLAVNVLVVDDDPVFLAALHPMLEPWGIRLSELADPLRFWEVLQSAPPDLLILDVDMPQLSGIQLCQAVRADPYWQGLPILFLTAHRDPETIQQVFAAGADDYVTKPVVGPELLTRITNRLERARLLQTLSSRDPLTGLANQPRSSRDLEQMLRQEEGVIRKDEGGKIEEEENSVSSCNPEFSAVQRQATSACPFCLAVFSLAELHQINRQYGHAIGNQILQQWGRLFQSTFRGGEAIGYWGNGEFVVGLPGLTKAEAGDRLSELLTTLRQQIFTAPDSSRFQVGFSLGLAEYPLDGVSLQSLYRAASQLAP